MDETTAVVATTGKEDFITRIAMDWGKSIDAVKAAMTLSFPTLKTQGQYIMAFEVAKKYDLDPFVKEIYAYVDSRDRMVLITGKDGFLKIARKQAGYKQIVSAAVYASDDFEADFAAGIITKHIVTSESLKNRSGNPIGSYAILRMEGLPDIAKWADWEEYCPTKVDYSPWAKQKSAMICKCATSLLIKEAFGLSGLYDEAEVTADSFSNNYAVSEETKTESKSVADTIKRRKKPVEPVEQVVAEAEIIEVTPFVAEKEELKQEGVVELPKEPLPTDPVEEPTAEPTTEPIDVPEVVEEQREIEQVTDEEIEAALQEPSIDSIKIEHIELRKRFAVIIAEYNKNPTEKLQIEKTEVARRIEEINNILSKNGLI